MTEFIESIENVSLQFMKTFQYVVTHRLGHFYPIRYFAFTWLDWSSYLAVLCSLSMLCRTWVQLLHSGFPLDFIPSRGNTSGCSEGSSCVLRTSVSCNTQLYTYFICNDVMILIKSLLGPWLRLTRNWKK